MFKLLVFLKKNSGDYLYFKPHDYNLKSLIKNIKSDDIFILQCIGRKVVGYGLLRGWEEGYEVPSLGIIIDKDHRGLKLSEKMMSYLHKIANEYGCFNIMLKVNKDNKKAINLYKKMGYELSDYNEKLLVGYKKL
jgi:[ribosomal protein S18]-alanine N-acetyltransferase